MSEHAFNPRQEMSLEEVRKLPFEQRLARLKAQAEDGKVKMPKPRPGEEGFRDNPKR